MPLYTFRCPHCRKTERVFRKILERNAAPDCSHGAMDRLIEAPAIHADLPSYQSPIDGRWIDGKRARTEDLKRNQCRPWEGLDVERSEANKRLAEADKVFDTQIERGIHETLTHMGVEKQRILASAP